MAAIYKTALGHTGSGDIFVCDTISYKGSLWLVPEWLELQERDKFQPERAIRLDRFRFQVTMAHPHHDFLINEPVPEALLIGPTPHDVGPQYVVEMLPDVVLTKEEKQAWRRAAGPLQ